MTIQSATTPLEEVQHELWHKVEGAIVGLVTVLVAMRTNLPHLISIGNLFTALLTPVWLPYIRRYTNCAALLVLGGMSAISGVILTFLFADDHRIGLGTMFDNTVLLVGLLTSFGFLLWARNRLGQGLVITLFGVGLVLGVNHNDPLYSSGAWKFGYATGVTVLLLGIAHLVRSRAIELLTVITLMVASALTDSRSAFGTLMLVAAFLAWQMRPMQTNRVGSAFRGVLGLTLAAVAAYFVGQALILNGYLGRVTQQRSLQQINDSGSLIAGGRPEIAATVALMRDNIWGYGSGTRINHHDLLVAKTGMASIGYDPHNGYVERFMFGTTYEVHSVLGDLWTRFGLVGLAFGLLGLFVTLRWVGRSVTTSMASAALLFLVLRSLWNFFFAPWYYSMGTLALTLALVVMTKEKGEDQSGLAPATGKGALLSRGL